MALRRGGKNRARQKYWPGADAVSVREEKRHGWPSIVRSRLEDAGADTDLTETICRHGKFGQLRGVDPEDLLQEAIAAYLSGQSPITGMVSLMNQGRYEAPADSFLSEDGQRDIWNVIEDQFDRQSDNDRHDWIPDDPAERAQLLRDCQAALIRADKPRALDVGELGSSYRAVLSMRGYQQKAGCFKKDADRAEAEKEALRKIIFWCSPDDVVTAQSEIVKFSNFWASYKRRHMMEDVAIDSINSREEFLGIPAALWPMKLAA